MDIEREFEKMKAQYEKFDINDAAKDFGESLTELSDTIDKNHDFLSGANESMGFINAFGTDMSVFGLVIGFMAALFFGLIPGWFFISNYIKQVRLDGWKHLILYPLVTLLALPNVVMLVGVGIYFATSANDLEIYYISAFCLGVLFPVVLFLYTDMITNKPDMDESGEIVYLTPWVETIPKPFIIVTGFIFCLVWISGGIMWDNIFSEYDHTVPWFSLLALGGFLFGSYKAYKSSIVSELLFYKDRKHKVITLENIDEQSEEEKSFYEQLLRMCKNVSFEACVLYVIPSNSVSNSDYFKPNIFDKKNMKCFSLVVSDSMIYSLTESEREIMIAEILVDYIAFSSNKINIVNSFTALPLMQLLTNGMGGTVKTIDNMHEKTLKVGRYDGHGRYRLETIPNPSNMMLKMMAVPFMITMVASFLMALVANFFINIIVMIKTFTLPGKRANYWCRKVLGFERRHKDNHDEAKNISRKVLDQDEIDHLEKVSLIRQ